MVYSKEPVYKIGKLDFELISRMIDKDLSEDCNVETEEALEEFIVLKMVRDV
jgi:hypothetical protein